LSALYSVLSKRCFCIEHTVLHVYLRDFTNLVFIIAYEHVIALQFTSLESESVAYGVTFGTIV